MTVTADRIIAALADNDPDLARFRIAQLDTDALRDLCMDLAKRVQPFADDTLSLAIHQAARAFNVDPLDIPGPSRLRQITDARQVVCAIGHAFGMTYSSIGARLNRDHTTVMHAVVRVGETPRLRGVAQRIAGELGWDREKESA